uniref:Transposase, Ptta/En/Spm n=1 Tax=Tanacetum cinerariifolium TaxID=118510 RepID=A0A699GQF9_TANCI|nr:hypothetical protein [Tanacetum cinerariifolium]
MLGVFAGKCGLRSWEWCRGGGVEYRVEERCSDDNKGVSSEGPSITSIPKEGPSIARRSKEPILKELLEWYGYDTVEDYLLVAKKLIPKVIFKSLIPIKGYSNDEDADGTNHSEDADGTNHSDLNLVKRGITMLYKFRKENGKLGGINIKRYFNVDLTVRKLVMHHLGKLLRNFRMNRREKYILSNLNTPSKLNEIPAKYSAIVKADEWVEFVNYTTTDTYKEKSSRGKMARSKNVFHHKIGRGGYVFMKEKMIENKENEADEEPPRGIMWLKGRVNKDREFTDAEIRSVGDKLKEADDKIKEGTLNLDDGTDAMTTVFDKEKGGYARGVGSGVTYKRRERQQKDVLVKKLSNEMTETKGMLSQLMNPLATQGVQLNLSSQLQVALDVTPMGVYEVDRTRSSVVIRDKDARIQKKSNGLVTLKKEPVKMVRPKKTPKSRRNGSQDSQSQALPNDCYKVSIDTSLVDAACIPDVGNNGLKTVKDGEGGFFAWPKNQVVLDEEVTPPTTIQKISDYNSAPKLQSKHKNHVSPETM